MNVAQRERENGCVEKGMEVNQRFANWLPFLGARVMGHKEKSERITNKINCVRNPGMMQNGRKYTVETLYAEFT